MPGRAGFEDVFESLFVAAYHVAHRIVGSAAEAEDIAAEATARALDRWRRVGGMASPKGWVVRVATNLAIDTVRRRRFVATIEFETPAEADDADNRIAVREMLRRLPRRQRDVLALRYLADLSEAEIAVVLGISPGSVKRHASRALSRLRSNGQEGAISYAC